MGTLSALLAIRVVTSEFPSQRPATRSFDVSLMCAWTNIWTNNREAGDLTGHRDHYDVTVIIRLVWNTAEPRHD